MNDKRQSVYFTPVIIQKGELSNIVDFKPNFKECDSIVGLFISFVQRDDNYENIYFRMLPYYVNGMLRYYVNV